MSENVIKETENKKNSRGRNWTFVLYPESAKAEWLEYLKELHIQFVVSPLHDRDTDTEGRMKKEHYHILVMYEGNKSYEQIKIITEELNATIPQIAGSVKGLVRYMLHMDDPNKFKYQKEDMIVYGGVDVIVEFKSLMDYAMKFKFDDWFPLLCDNSAYVIQEYIKSNRYKSDR
ncbi:replication protein [Thermus scotoductus]|uniref:replication protein n=1 Tax=Thermus scotoductus TaxID=37636 RepID=UPI0009DA897F|nr:replication protein [Thermus scotoductus]